MMKSRWRKKTENGSRRRQSSRKKKQTNKKNSANATGASLQGQRVPKVGRTEFLRPYPIGTFCWFFFSTGFYWLFTVVGCPFLGSIRVFFARYDRVLTVFLTVFLGVARFWLCPRVYYRALLGFTGFHCVLPGFTVFYRVLLDFTEFYWVLLGFTGFYWVLLGYTRFYWVFIVSLNLTRFKLGFSCFE